MRATSSTAAVPTDIPEQQDSISADADSDDDDTSATMPTTGSLTRAIVEMEDDTADAMLETILQWAMDVKGVELYEAQEEAILELVEGNNVLLTTPTGSGKTMVATAAIAAATARGDAAWYTAPLKALVTEKFFQLVKDFGAKNVGLLTGDASVNPTAPIICCTAEVLANAALRRGRDLDCGLIVADEFHFYADPDRGWAWQVPMVEIPDAQFLLMSATFGDTAKFQRHLEGNAAGRDVGVVGGGERPVPLEFEYRETSLIESIKELVDTDRAPVYIVNFSQREANERAQDLCSTLSLTTDEKKALNDELGGFKFDTPVGNELRRYISFGVGVHHAGLLPKYRLLVERLAGKGLLKCICGTDTLGVGVNVPIRAVLFTQLCKFDGIKTRLLTIREFQQIAGRAGRRGFDTKGFVWCQAPAHVVENKRAEAKAAAAAAKSGGKAKKVKKSQPPDKNFVQWNEDNFRRMETGAPETLDSSFQVTHSMILAVLSRKGDGKRFLRDLLVHNHEPKIRQRKHQRRAISMYRSLKDAGIIQETGTMDTSGRAVNLGFDIGDQFSLTQPLSLFAVEYLPTLLKTHGTDHSTRSKLRDERYALDVLSVLEAVLDTPGAVVNAQVNKAKTRAVNKMKGDGVEYDDRMAVLEEMDYPKPLKDELEAYFEPFKRRHPYVGAEELKPKSIARELYESGYDFNKYVTHYGLNRSEGALMRYLTDAYKAMVQNVPESMKSPAVIDVEEWLGETIRMVDSSLIDEWEALKDPVAAARAAEDEAALVALGASRERFTSGRAFRVMVRNAAFRWVQLLAVGEEEDMQELAAENLPPRGRDTAWKVDQLYDLIDPYWHQHEQMDDGYEARSPDLFNLSDDGDDGDAHWRVVQKIRDPAGDLDWCVEGEVDLEASETEGRVVMRLVEIRQEGAVKKEEAAKVVPSEEDIWAAMEETEYEDGEE